MSRFDIICLGEAMGEIAFAPDGSTQIGVGGDTLNSAVYLARSGINVAFASAIGDDPFGTRIRATLQENAVSDVLLLNDPVDTTGLYSITNDATGERFFHYWRNAAAARKLFAEPSEDWLEGMLDTRMIYLSGISLYTFNDHLPRLFELLERARAKGVEVAFDGNYRPRLWAGKEDLAREAFERVMALSSVVLPTFEDEVMLWNDVTPEATLARIAELGVETIVLKRGPEGCTIRGTEAETLVPIPTPIKVVDTTAAGDSFNAGFLAARLRGEEDVAAALAGHRLAGRVISHRGALIPKEAMLRDRG
ncbi:sugar kinase [Celeribacter halophilus]|uniref:2-dehydro-3-deoxygluconokinase n=1 Tax=Celeribacter halophilus TaxID=576117 RepID=A0A1I3W9I1_9RHOB|nr:sugar kinase [Celeribacter halophilus]PZX09350.1 2-dehydro-3-deoxygluconokinase [Celeribacter halophilus]SFK03111.1 2-dehydro-3-deoxygluconokinase [Celeribacter halophilus]